MKGLKTIKAWSRKKKIKFCVLAVVILFILLCLVEFVPVFVGEFSPGTWERYPRLRGYMIDDMEKETGLWELSRKEIILILGIPSDNYEDEYGGGLSYFIGTGLLGNDSYYIAFDKEGEVFYTGIVD